MLRIKAITATALVAALLLGSSGARAAEEVGRAYLKGLGTYISADSDRFVDDGVDGGLVGFGYAVSEHFNVELDYQRLNLNGENCDPGANCADGVAVGESNPDQDQSILNVNVMNLYNRDGLLAPYILAGIGVASTDGGDGSNTDDVQGQIGVGMLTRLWGSRLSLRSEVLARGQHTSDENLTDVLVNVGLSVALGSKPVPAAVPVVAAAPPPPPPPPPPPADSDGDGVIDPNDQCPDTPKGDRVGPRGCSCDVTRQVQFKLNSAELTDADKATLDEMAVNLTKLQFISGTVVGHTDSSGTEAYNLKLSERRAETVAAYLQGKGIAVGRLAASGAGESEPIADNKTTEGRALNRRVVLKRTDCDAPK